MPFGSVFGAIVFGVFGALLGTKMIGHIGGSVKLMGACLAVAGISVAAGLLTKRGWARWLGVFSGVWFAWSAADGFLTDGGVFYLTAVLAAAASAVLLIVPATGRPQRDPAAGPPGDSRSSRVLLSAACLAIAGFVGATAWGVARQPVARAEPVASPPESRQGEARPVPPPTAVTWHDFADGLKQAKLDRKLVVADFYATWCGPCKLMEKRTFHDPRVLARLRDVIPVRVDAEETTDRGGLRGADLAERYGIEAYPTIVVVDGRGREVARNSGVMSPDDFLAWLDRIIERAGTSVARS